MSAWPPHELVVLREYVYSLDSDPATWTAAERDHLLDLSRVILRRTKRRAKRSRGTS